LSGTYKAALEDLLNKIILLSDIAKLAVEAERTTASQKASYDSESIKQDQSEQKNKIRWESLRFNIEKPKQTNNLADANETKQKYDDERTGVMDDDVHKAFTTESTDMHPSGALTRQRSTLWEKLDRWEEPDDKSNEV
jgi:hypothetical protein